VNNEKLLNYVDIILKQGISIEKGRKVCIKAPIESVELVRLLSEKAYEYGAADVHYDWRDDRLTFLRYKNCEKEIFEKSPKWLEDRLNSYGDEEWSLISIIGDDPELLKTISSEKIAANAKTMATISKDLRDKISKGSFEWTIAAYPTTVWAEKVYPNLKGEEAKSKLWEAIFKISRADRDNPLKSWERHLKVLNEKMNFLNEGEFKEFHYRGPGTDLKVGMPKAYKFIGGDLETYKGTRHLPNIPTEEVFSAPHKYRVEGKLSSTLPLNYGGNLIEDFTLYFEEGKVVNFEAKKGYETLENLLNTDEGAKRLGEIALVPEDSPIANSKTLFYTTLYDENASCHFAIGTAYKLCVEGAENMSEEELDKAGVNESLTHVDFMVGSKDLDIDGIKEDGTIVPIFRKGNWSF